MKKVALITGVTGQDGAYLSEFLLKKGYQILACNWRFKKAEIDIIAKEEDVLVFIEVKTRSDDYMGRPAEFVTTQKEELLADAASVYMEQIHHEWEIRFDVIGIIIRPSQASNGPQEIIEIEHFKDAFFPGW